MRTQFKKRGVGFPLPHQKKTNLCTVLDLEPVYCEYCGSKQGKVCGCGCGRYCRYEVTCDMWLATATAPPTTTPAPKKGRKKYRRQPTLQMTVIGLLSASVKRVCVSRMLDSWPCPLQATPSSLNTICLEVT